MRSTVAVGRGEVLLEPLRRLEIEVIGRLVEQQDVGRAHELPRKAEAATLAALTGSRARASAPPIGSKPSPCRTASTRGAMV